MRHNKCFSFYTDGITIPKLRCLVSFWYTYICFFFASKRGQFFLQQWENVNDNAESGEKVKWVHCCRVPIESISKNFVTLVHKFFPSAFIGNTYRIYMKKLVYKSYKVFSYRFYSFVPININSVSEWSGV